MEPSLQTLEANIKPSTDRHLIPGKPDYDRCDNKVISARYTPWTFFPVAITEQFRRFANLYFLIVGFIMAIGYYTSAFQSAISPWTTLGPLALVIAFSLLVEGSADLKRHRNDAETNQASCVVLTRTDDLVLDENAERDETILRGKDVLVNLNKEFYAEATTKDGGVKSPPLSATNNNTSNSNVCRIAFQKLPRQDIRQGHFCVVKNREMVPADMVLIASSNDHGSAYIETSSIDGETNLKLRTSPHLPRHILKQLRTGQPLTAIEEGKNEETATDEDEEDEQHEFETIEDAVKRLTRFSYLGRPGAKSALQHPDYVSAEVDEDDSVKDKKYSLLETIQRAFSANTRRASQIRLSHKTEEGQYVAGLTTEPPNPSVHTFVGKLTLPPLAGGSCYDIALDADNVLLRGAVIRNTEWVIGIAFFTGTDTKLVQNSFKTRSKFSQLDRLMNKTVAAVLTIMALLIVYLASFAVTVTNEKFDELWYVGFNKNVDMKWPYLPGDLPAPNWRTNTDNWIQYFFMYVTLLSNFVPLSMYITVEFITFCMLWFVYVDLEMYDNTTNTRAVARSTIVSDLGRIQYIFSDKTGTLTQNVMRFKRCSVDGLVFGTPIQRTRPGAEQVEEEQTPFYPLRQLLVGQFKAPRAAGLEGLGVSGSGSDLTVSQTLTFNAEMFLRVMSLCHTVVVEKDIDKKTNIDSGASTASNESSLSAFAKKLFGRSRANTADSFARSRANTSDSLPPLAEEEEAGFSAHSSGAGTNRGRIVSVGSLAPGQNIDTMKGADGAPYGYAYQAESPDEGALVSAASSTFGFQVMSRDSSGIRLRLTSPSHLQNERVTSGLKDGSLSLKRLAAETASELDDDAEGSAKETLDSVLTRDYSEETWSILAVNKFDSDRKRMSVLLRSPPELGSLPILFCKGADSSMLDPDVCAASNMLKEDGSLTRATALNRPSAISTNDRIVSELTTVDENENDNDIDEDGWEMAQMLGLQAHLGDFASEGLRTLVLGMRVLSEEECESWLEGYKTAATALNNRSELLTAAATKIEKGLHIVGATAIEDKLQNKVPETIATLAKAGIKLWVLTGDKRETAVEIGYSTHVLTPKMHLTEVPDNGKLHVCTQMAMEFLRLVKMGKLPQYQKSALDDSHDKGFRRKMSDCMFSFRKMLRALRRSIAACFAGFLLILGFRARATKRIDELKAEAAAESKRLKEIEERRLVRRRAEKLIKKWLKSDEGKKQSRMRRARSEDEELSLASDETPGVFTRASSAKSLLKDMRSSGKLSNAQLREVSLAQLTAAQAGGDEPLVDEDALSLDSFFPGNKDDLQGNFDRKKRTILERLFAIDRDVRKGKLTKHVRSEKLATLTESGDMPPIAKPEADGSRALVIEGSALKHLLGNKELETILFSVASNCDAVIACRVSPKQKAELLNLVRFNIRPEPITLAIGDGANDVGMIQEAHVGVGISGKEGKQAVNASDFAIAQFRFLETLILVHGRWDFFRLSTVVLFSFYKNVVMAGILIAFAPTALYSGTPLFDQWLIAMLNFVAGLPIIVLGLFDRCLDKDYIRKHPEVYKASRENELITTRVLIRWIIITLVHIIVLYYFTFPQQRLGGGMTPAWQGLMSNENRGQPGNGEGGDIKSVGTVTFTCMVILLAYKVLYESRSLIHGIWPAFTCRKGVGEGFFSRVAYTWWGVAALSIGFYLWAIEIYSLIGRAGPSQFSQFTEVASHVLGTRSLSSILILFVPMIGIALDVIGKCFSNMFYPTQTQIHIELAQKERAKLQKRRLLRASSWRRSEGNRGNSGSFGDTVDV